MSKVDQYRQTLRSLDDWEPYLLAGSGLPGPRGNIELALLRNPAHVERTLQILDAITTSLAQATDRRSDAFQALRKGLAYCWSVAVVARPEAGKPMMERWLASTDRDVRWIMRQNLAKQRLVRADASWVANWLAQLAA